MSNYYHALRIQNQLKVFYTNGNFNFYPHVVYV